MLGSGNLDWRFNLKGASEEKEMQQQRGGHFGGNGGINVEHFGNSGARQRRHSEDENRLEAMLGRTLRSGA